MKSQINSVRDPDHTSVRLRWYKGILLLGDQRKRQQIINKIGQDTVMSLAEHIPYMFLERADGSSRECYIFFAIKSEKFNKLHEEIFDQLPNVIQDFLNRELNRSHFDRNVSFNENLSFRSYSKLKEFLEERRGDDCRLDVINFQIPIPPQPIPPSNLSGDHLPSETYNNLLYWLSSRGSGSWESFRFACNALRIPEPRQVLRRLKLLGHIEASSNGSRWSGTPITLVSVRASHPNQQEFILCGQRSLNLLSFLELEHYASISHIEQPQGNAPHCIRVCLPHTEDISRLVNALVGHGFPIHNEGNASLKFAQALPSWQEWMQTLPRTSAPILGYRYEYYDLEESRFIKCISHNETGMYRLKHEKSGQSRVYFFDGVSDRWLQGDWYGLRFLALQHYNQNNQTLNAHYDRETASLYIPRSQRWPEIYQRALVLASGCLPSDVKTENFGRTLHYQGIQAEVAELLTSKLSINLH